MPGFLDDYEPVEDRIRAFWEDHPDGRILTKKMDAPEGEYVFYAVAVLSPDDELPAASGWAHESVAQLPANMKASALEVCETSAIGRALANLGYAPKGKRPSREEMSARQEPSTSPPADGAAPEHADAAGAAPQSSGGEGDLRSSSAGDTDGSGEATPNPPAILEPVIAGPKEWTSAQRELKTRTRADAQYLVLQHLKGAYGVKSLEEIDVDMLRMAVSALVLAKRTVNQ